jgi:hypothetical protein
MKPLATPVLGGMLSSLIHVLIVTPVIFTWLRQSQIRMTANKEMGKISWSDTEFEMQNSVSDQRG